MALFGATSGLRAAVPSGPHPPPGDVQIPFLLFQGAFGHLESLSGRISVSDDQLRANKDRMGLQLSLPPAPPCCLSPALWESRCVPLPESEPPEAGVRLESGAPSGRDEYSQGRPYSWLGGAGGLQSPHGWVSVPTWPPGRAPLSKA